MLSPKQRFQKTPEAKKHFDLTASESFQKTVDAALLQYAATITIRGPTNDPQVAMAEYHRMAGALQFADMLMTFADLDKPVERKDTMNLNHRA